MPTWRGALRAIAASARRAERAAQRRRRELMKQQKELEKMEALQRAAYEVEVYENQINLLLSVHKESSDIWDWQAIRATEKPSKPEMSRERENEAQRRLDQYSPSLLDKVFRRENQKREALAKSLEQAKTEDKKTIRRSIAAV